MKNLILATTLLNISCGTIRIKGTTDNNVSGEIGQKITLYIPMCEELPPQDKLECIRAVIDLLKTLSKEKCEVNPDGTLPNSKACQEIVEALKPKS